MSPSELNALHIVHVAAVVTMIAYTFYAFAAAPETKRSVLTLSGIAALVVVATGLRMWQGLYSLAPLGWIFVKIVCWLGIAGLGGAAYKRREKRRLFMTIVLGLALVALVMVYTKPF